MTDNVTISQKSRLIPYFSPSEYSQLVIIYPLENCIRILEHRMERDPNTGDENLRPKRVKKILIPNMTEKLNIESIHTAVATANEELLILVDKKNLNILDMRDLEKGEDGAYTVEEIICHKDFNIQSLQLIEDRFMYIMFNKVKGFQYDSRAGDPKARARLALLQSGNGTGLMDLDIIRKNP